MTKMLLDESKAILKEAEELPAVEITGPIGVEPTTDTEVPQEVEANAFKGLITDLIQSEWNSINNLNSVIATLVGTEYENISDILNAIADEKVVQIGMLTKASEMIDNSDSVLMNQGVEQAETIVSEPAKDLE